MKKADVRRDEKAGMGWWQGADVMEGWWRIRKRDRNTGTKGDTDGGWMEMVKGTGNTAGQYGDRTGRRGQMRGQKGNRYARTEMSGGGDRKVEKDNGRERREQQGREKGITCGTTGETAGGGGQQRRQEKGREKDDRRVEEIHIRRNEAEGREDIYIRRKRRRTEGRHVRRRRREAGGKKEGRKKGTENRKDTRRKEVAEIRRGDGRGEREDGKRRETQEEKREEEKGCGKTLLVPL